MELEIYRSIPGASKIQGLDPGDNQELLKGTFSLLLSVSRSPGSSPVLISLLIPEDPRQKKARRSAWLFFFPSFLVNFYTLRLCSLSRSSLPQAWRSPGPDPLSLGTLPLKPLGFHSHNDTTPGVIALHLLQSLPPWN